MRLASSALLVSMLAPVPAQEPPARVADLLARLSSPEFAVRRDAARAARGVCDPRLTSRLVELVSTVGEHPTVRAFAAESLGSSGDPRAHGVLVEASRGPNPFVRERAFAALGATGDPRAFDVLVAALSDPNVGAGAAEGLAELGDPRAYPILAVRIREHGPDARGFDAIGAAALRLDRRAAAILLFAELERQEARAVAPLVRLLRACPDVPEVRDGAERLADSDDPVSRRAALAILAGVGDLGTVSLLLRRLREDDQLRVAVIDALGEIGHEFAVDPVARWLADPDARVRIAAVTALARISHPTAAEPLRSALRQAELPLVAIRAAEALGRLRDQAALQALASRLDDQSRSSQPPEMSRLMTYPHNVNVCDVAWWAARSILDGAEPCELGPLSQLGSDRPRTTPEQRETLARDVDRALRGR